MNILSKQILDIEDQWREKTKRDVENFHTLKMQEMTYKMDEQRDVISPHWSDNLVSPQHGRITRREKGELKMMMPECSSSSMTAEHDKYYILAQR
jgi:hypothetical protein